jgi:predicted nucleotidyltransferase
MTDVLTPEQRAIAERVTAEEEACRKHIVLAISGAHAYGFPSPDSDVDLKGIHVLPTAQIVGLHPPRLHVDRMEVIDGVEIDYSSNEIGTALASILKGNGNFIERVFAHHTTAQHPWRNALITMVRESLSKRVFTHYAGFAATQRRELARRPTVKRLLYVLRTALTGVHMLRAREVFADVTALLDDYGFDDAHELVERKLAGERAELSEDEVARWNPMLDRAFAALTDAHAASPLPEEPTNARQFDDLLVGLRRALF